MSQVQIQKVRPTHEAIMDFIIANPGPALQRRCATAFGLTEAWVSVIINSDAFQAKYRDRRDELFAANIVPLHEKMLGVAHLGVDKLGDFMSQSTDPDFVKDATDKLLHRLGYAPKTSASPAGPAVQQNNYFGVTSSDLAAARARIVSKGGPDAPPVALEATSSVPAGEEPDRHTPALEGTAVPSRESTETRGEGEGEGV